MNEYTRGSYEAICFVLNQIEQGATTKQLAETLTELNGCICKGTAEDFKGRLKAMSRF